MAEMPGIARPERQAFPRLRGGDPNTAAYPGSTDPFSPPTRG